MPLNINNVSHTYGDSPPVLKDVSIVIEVGGSVAITGPSGSGKTTLLSIIGGLISPTQGTVMVDTDGIDVRPLRSTFAWVFQTTNLLARRTVMDNVAIGLLQHGQQRTDTEAPVLESLASVGLASHALRASYTLSGGEAQRVGVARAVVSGVPWILADEPTGHLDRSTSDEISELLLDARRPDQGVLIATHDLRLAERCDTRFMIEHARLVEMA